MNRSEIVAALLMQQAGGKKTVLDKTLGTEGAAADAGAVGAAIAALRAELDTKASSEDLETGLKGKMPMSFGAANAGKHMIVSQNGRMTLAYTGRSGTVQLPSPEAIREIAAAGEAAQSFTAGDLVKNSWKDTAANKNYDMPLRINHFSTETLEDGTLVQGLWVQAQYAHPFGVQFSQYQAIMVCEDGLAAGTYSFTFGDTLGGKGFVSKGNSFHFTLKNAVPAGGRLAGLRGSWDADDPCGTLDIRVYAQDRKTVLETAGIAQGKDGTDLGTLTIAGSEALNSIHRFSYGDNCWSRSALRQYLNSDKPKGQWWTPQSKWDLAPDQLDSVDGYLCGFSASMLAALKSVMVQTCRNTVCYDDKAQGDTPDVTYDRVTLPSLEQMFAVPQIEGEGDAQEYYVHLNGTGTKYKQWKAYPELRTYTGKDRSAAQHVRLRSAYRGHGYITWYLRSDGSISSGSNGAEAWRFAPMMFIGG